MPRTFRVEFAGKSYRMEWEGEGDPTQADFDAFSQAAGVQYMKTTPKKPAPYYVAAPKRNNLTAAGLAKQRAAELTNERGAATPSTPEEVRQYGTSGAVARSDRRQEEAGYKATKEAPLYAALARREPGERIERKQAPTPIEKKALAVQRQAESAHVRKGKNSLIERMHEVAQETPGVLGGAQNIAVNLVDPNNLLMLLMGGGAASLMGKAAAPVFGAMQVGQSAQDFANTDLMRTDPAKYWTQGLGNLLLGIAPNVPSAVRSVKGKLNARKASTPTAAAPGIQPAQPPGSGTPDVQAAVGAVGETAPPLTPPVPAETPRKAQWTPEEQAYIEKAQVKEGWMPRKSIAINEKAFQFRKRTVADFPNWNVREAAKNPISVWTDKAGELGIPGQTYAVNGHNRYLNAEKFDVPALRVRHIEATTAAKAKEIGAIENLLDSPRNTSVDVAYFLRNTTLPQGGAAEFLREHGVNTQAPLMRESVALSRLPEDVFDTLYRDGDTMTGLKNVAVAVAENFDDPVIASAEFKEMHRRMQEGQKITPEFVAERAKVIAAEKATREQAGMDFDFGDVDTRARVAEKVKKHFSGLIASGKGLSKKIAETYYEVTGEQRDKAQLARELGFMIDQTAHRKSPLGTRISQTVQRIAEGVDEDAEVTALIRDIETGDLLRATLTEGRVESAGLGEPGGAHNGLPQATPGQAEGADLFAAQDLTPPVPQPKPPEVAALPAKPIATTPAKTPVPATTPAPVPPVPADVAKIPPAPKPSTETPPSAKAAPLASDLSQVPKTAEKATSDKIAPTKREYLPETKTTVPDFTKLNTPEEARTAILSRAKELAKEGKVSENVRGVRSWKTTEEAANELGLSLADVKAMKIGSAVNAETLDAMRGMLVTAQQKVKAAADAYKAADTSENLLRVKEAQAEADTILLSLLGRRAEAARSLNVLKKTRGALGYDAERQAVAQSIIEAIDTPQPASVKEAAQFQVKRKKADFGTENKLFTRDRMEAANARLQEKFNRVSAGVDPTIVKDAAEVLGFYMEGGVRSVATAIKYAKQDYPGIDDETLKAAAKHLREEARKRAQSQQTPREKVIQNLVKDLGEDEARAFVDKVSAIPADAPDAVHQYNKVLRDAAKFSNWDKVSAYQKANLLSGPGGVARDVFSTGVWQATDNLLFRPLRGGGVGESWAAMKGMRAGIRVGIKEMVNTIKHGYSETAAQRLDLPSYYEFRGGAKNPFNLVPRARAGVNELQRAMAEGAELYAQAHKQAVKEGKTGADQAARIQELAANPTEEMRAAAVAYGDEMTFTQEPDKLLRAINNLRRVKGVNLLVPFFNTTYNLTKTGLKSTPLGYTRLLSKDLTPMQRRQQIVQATAGSALMAAIAPYALEGRVTGSMPEDEGERKRFLEDGKQPYSIKVGDKWVQYQNFGAAAIPIAITAAFVDAMRTKDDKGQPVSMAWDARIGKAAFALSEAVKDNTGIFGIVDLLESGKSEKERNRYIGQFTSGFLPMSSGLRGVAQAQDDLKRDPRAWYEWVMNGLPGARPTLAPKVTREGVVLPNLNKGLMGYSPVKVLPTKPPQARRITAEEQRKANALVKPRETKGSAPITVPKPANEAKKMLDDARSGMKL